MNFIFLRSSVQKTSLFLVLAAVAVLGGIQSNLAAAANQKTRSGSSLSPVSKSAPKGNRGEKPGKSVKTATPEVAESYMEVTTEELVDKPQEYLNKNVKFTGTFFAFSSLALDYKPAFRPSKSYLSFLVLRSHSHIPLSELKLALPIPKEKDPENQLIAVLKDGDIIDLSGHVFSTALGEPWVDVRHIKKIGGSNEKTADTDQAHDNKDKAADSPDGASEDNSIPNKKQ